MGKQGQLKPSWLNMRDQLTLSQVIVDGRELQRLLASGPAATLKLAKRVAEYAVALRDDKELDVAVGVFLSAVPADVRARVEVMSDAEVAEALAEWCRAGKKPGVGEMVDGGYRVGEEG